MDIKVFILFTAFITFYTEVKTQLYCLNFWTKINLFVTVCPESTHSPMPRKIDHQSHGSEYSKSHQHRQQTWSIWCPVRKPTKQIPEKTGGKFSLFHQSWRKLLLETILKVRKIEFEFSRQKCEFCFSGHTTKDPVNCSGNIPKLSKASIISDPNLYESLIFIADFSK